jgi:hypothetical protein
VLIGAGQHISPVPPHFLQIKPLDRSQYNPVLQYDPFIQFCPSPPTPELPTHVRFVEAHAPG